MKGKEKAKEGAREGGCGEAGEWDHPKGIINEEAWMRWESQQTAAWHQLVKTVEKHYQCP